MKKLLHLALLALLIPMSASCAQKLDWNDLEAMYLFYGKVQNFNISDPEKIIQTSNYRMFDVAKVKAKLENAKEDGNSSVWKGGTQYAIAKLKSGEFIKIRLSRAYGVYYVVDYKQRFVLKDDDTLRSGRWEELLFEEE